MKIVFHSKSLNIDEILRKNIEQRFERLDRYFSKIEKFIDNEDSLFLDLYIDHQKGFYNVKVVFNLDGNEIVIKDSANDLYDVINSIVDSLEVKLSRYKDKVVVGSRHKIKLSNLEVIDNKFSSSNNKEVDLVRKKLSVPVISENKAVNYLLSDENLKYIVFYNRDTDKLSLLERIDNNTFNIYEIII